MSVSEGEQSSVGEQGRGRDAAIDRRRPRDADCACAPDSSPHGQGRRAVVIVAPAGPGELADSFRKRYDPEWFERVPPHVSLLGPFEAREPDAELALALGWALAGCSPFRIRLGPPGAFLVPELVLFFTVRDEEPLRDLHARVLRALPAYAPARQFHPHLTVGRFASEAALSGALAELKEAYAKALAAGASSTLEFPVPEVQLYGEHPQTGVYSSVASVALGGRSAAPA